MLHMDNPYYPDWPEGLLTEQEAADRLGMAYGTLSEQRRTGRPVVAHVPVGSRACYWAEDVATASARRPGRPSEAAREAYSPPVASRPAPPASALRKVRKVRQRVPDDELKWTRDRRERDLSVLDRAVDGYLSEKDANLYLGISPRYGLASRRANGTAPAHELRNHRIVYRIEDLDAFDPKAATREAGLRRRDPNPTYSAMHRRVCKAFGSASEHDCEFGCGSPARDWAFIGDQDYLVADAERHRPRDRGMKYTTDAYRYVALCRSCHMLYDSRNEGRQRVEGAA